MGVPVSPLVFKVGLAGGNQGAGDIQGPQLNHQLSAPPVTGALGVIGLSGRASQQRVAQAGRL